MVCAVGVLSLLGVTLRMPQRDDRAQVGSGFPRRLATRKKSELPSKLMRRDAKIRSIDMQIGTRSKKLSVRAQVFVRASRIAYAPGSATCMRAKRERHA